jgi:hypothetical protein
MPDTSEAYASAYRAFLFMRTTHNDSVTEMTTAPVVVPPPSPITPHIPEFVRLPRPGTRCPFTGLSRGFMNTLILPMEANGHKPPVRSYALRRNGAKTGVRLISGTSLVNFILAHAETGNAKKGSECAQE